MSHKLSAAVWLGCLLGASAGQSYPTDYAPDDIKLPNLDVAWGLVTYSDGMDFDHLNGSLSVTQFDLFSLLSKPITVAGDVKLLSAFQYGFTDFDFDGTHPAFPLPDEELHDISLHLAAFKMFEGSPWFCGAWARAELATDFENVNDDDFTFDLAAGVGYRVNDRLVVAAGAAFLNFNGDFWICPGINFDWEVNDQLRVGLYGPIAVLSYTPDENWNYSLRGTPGGGIWNIDGPFGASKSIDLSSYQVGGFVGRRLTGQLWLNAGVGVTTFNNLKLSDTDGNHSLFDEEMEWGFFGQIGLSLKAW